VAASTKDDGTFIEILLGGATALLAKVVEQTLAYRPLSDYSSTSA
jgi:hypothetical protein